MLINILDVNVTFTTELEGKTIQGVYPPDKEHPHTILYLGGRELAAMSHTADCVIPTKLPYVPLDALFAFKIITQEEADIAIERQNTYRKYQERQGVLEDIARQMAIYNISAQEIEEVYLKSWT